MDGYDYCLIDRIIETTQRFLTSSDFKCFWDYENTGVWALQKASDLLSLEGAILSFLEFSSDADYIDQV